MKDSFTRKQIAGLVDIPAERVRFYYDQGLVLPEVADTKRRGTVRRYSRRNLLEFLILKELSDCGFSIEKQKDIMFHLKLRANDEPPLPGFWDSDRDRLKEGSLYLVAYAPYHGRGMMLRIDIREPGNNAVGVLMDRYKWAFVLDIPNLLEGSKIKEIVTHGA